MSRVVLPKVSTTPLIELLDRASRAMQRHMVNEAHARGYPEIKYSHNAVFGSLLGSGSRATDMADRAGITRQSMGEIIRDMVDLGFLEMQPDPDDRRAKLVSYTAYGREMASGGRQHLIELEQRFAEEFGEKEYETVRDFLERLVPLLRDEDE